MNRVLAVMGAILLKLQLFLGIPPVLAGCVVLSLAIAALKRYKLHNLFLTRHVFLLLNASGQANEAPLPSPIPTPCAKFYKVKLPRPKCFAFWSALDQN